MANNNSTVHNRAVQNIDQPFTELFDLLPQLNNKSSEFSQGEIQHAIEVHLSNVRLALTNGIQSLGVLLALAAEHDDDRLPNKHITNIGWLTQNLMNLMEACFISENFGF